MNPETLGTIGTLFAGLLTIGVLVGLGYQWGRESERQRRYDKRVLVYRRKPTPPDNNGAALPVPDSEATDASHNPYLLWRGDVSVFDRSVHEPDIRKRLDQVRRRNEGKQEAA